MTAGEQLAWKLKRESWEEGEKKGREEGEKKGREEKELQIAKAMKTQNFSIEMISRCTGLSPAQIEVL